MRINHIEAVNFQILKRMAVSMQSPVTLFCGHNMAGKTSLHEAVRFALEGVTVRVSAKKDYPQLVREGQKAGSVSVVFNDGENEIELTRTLPKAEANTSLDIPALPYVLDAPRFVKLDQPGRRAFVIESERVDVTADGIAKRLRQRKARAEYVDQLKPLLAAGFETAAKEAASNATQAKGAWKQITGETWGSNKGDGWAPAEVQQWSDEDATMLIELEADRAQAQAKVQAARERLSDAQAMQRIAAALLTCPCCESSLRMVGGILQSADDEQLPFDESRMSAATDAMNQAIEALAAVGEAIQPLLARRDAAEKGAQAAELAAAQHAAICDWSDIAAALAPDGIQADIMDEALAGMNATLRAHCTAVSDTWPLVQIRGDMEVTSNGRPYRLLSESEQLRCAAMIALAVSVRTGVGILMLDRFDLLDLPSRNALLMHLAKQDVQSILFATLKELPAKLPPTVAAYWIEHGEVKSATNAEIAA